MKKVILAAVAALCLMWGTAFAGNVVVNGDFSNGLEGWTFTDTSTRYGSCEAYVQDGKGVLHGRYYYGWGELTQTFDSTVPGRVEADFNLVGTCSQLLIVLRSGGEDRLTFTSWDYGWFSGSLGPRGMVLTDSSGMIDYWKGEAYNSGTLTMEFDGNNGYLYLDDELLEAFAQDSFSVDELTLEVRNNCWDGRNHVYGYFDNIVVEPATIEAEADIDPDTLNLQANGVLTAYITLPEGYSAGDIDTSTVECSGAPAARAMVEGDMLVAKFRRADLSGVEPGTSTLLTITGKLADGTPFVATDVVRVVSNGM